MQQVQVEEKSALLDLAAQAGVLEGQVAPNLRESMGKFTRQLRRLSIGERKAAIVAKLDSLTETSQVRVERADWLEVRDCVQFCRDPERVAAILDQNDYWMHATKFQQGLWSKLARIGGPALNDPRFPGFAVVAGGCLFALLKQKETRDVDVDVFVSTQDEADEVIKLLKHWDYSLHVKSANLTRAFYTVKKAKMQLDLVVHPLAKQPERMVRTFDAAPCEAWTCVKDGEYVTLTASAARSWSTMEISSGSGRAGALAKDRLLKLTDDKGFKHVGPVDIDDMLPAFLAPVADAMDLVFRKPGPGKREDAPYGNFLRRNLLFPWSDAPGPELKDWAVLTNFVDVVELLKLAMVGLPELAHFGFGKRQIRFQLYTPFMRRADAPGHKIQTRLLLIPQDDIWLCTYHIDRLVPDVPCVEFSQSDGN